MVPLEPFGSVVSLAGIEYEALWVDNQGSVSIHGQIYVGVRQDGTVLGILIEHVPAEDFESAFEDMTPILDNSYTASAGSAIRATVSGCPSQPRRAPQPVSDRPGRWPARPRPRRGR